MPLPALALALALQAAAPATGVASPEDKAAGVAALTFMYGCVLPISAYDTAAEYASAAAGLGADKLYAPPTLVGVHVDDAQGRGCRVHYSGPKAVAVWEADAKLLRPATPAPAAGDRCLLTQDTPNRIAALCTQTSDGQNGRPVITRRADVVLERSGSGAVSEVVGSVLNPRP